MKRLGTDGFTLVDAMLAVIVSTLVIITVTTYVMSNIQQSAEASTRDTLIKETETSLDLMAKDVRLSANADQDNRWPDSNAPGGDQFGWQSDDSTLVLATAAQDSADDVIFSDPNNYITEKNNIVYFVKDSTLYKRIIADPVSGNKAVTTCPSDSASSSCPADKELLHDVSLFDVTYLNGQNQEVSPTDARSIEVHVEVEKTSFKKPVEADYTTRMVFRND
jgi:type II secretory pathway component PulJ